MADYNESAKTLFNGMTDEEQKKALSMLQTLDGLEIERAYWILDFCKSALKTKAVVKI